ncbi:MAG: hypothetical protein BWZ02_01638 [Lentisphaerae bacterium ADurb.BinA184]|nr:MAG: hypothetical protein BWZ02_01638 [Lentisphaerae bacterium ADurb.BinA184]
MDRPFGKGDVLVSTIGLLDPNFQHTVVFLCEHLDGQGSYGLILNRALRVPPQLEREMPYVGNRLFQGGPVQPEVMQVLHGLGDGVPGAVEVIPGVWLGGDFEALQSGFASGVYSPEACRFFLGYSGWAKGQLAAEFKENTWIAVGATREMVFDTPPDQVWGEAIRKRGESDPLYAHYPRNPSWN